MSAQGLRALALLVCLAAVCACAPVRTRQTPESLATQAAREAQLAGRTRWALSAHIFVSDGGDNSGSGDLDWKQAGEHYDFILRAPTGKTWKLSGDAGHAVLEGVDPQPISGSDPERLLRERLGWEVPVADLSAWVRGMRRPPEQRSALQFNAQDLPAVLDQDGWRIEYRDWFADRTPPVPRKVFASRGEARVKMSIDSWSFDD
jgi:outer membrane lipoprotein LolB